MLEKLKNKIRNRAKRSWHFARPRTGVARTLFVLGVQRSGTNMLLDVFDRNFDTEVIRDGDSRAFAGFDLRPHTELQTLREATKAPVLVLKAQHDLEKTSELLGFLHPARAVWIYRHFDDMVNSNLRAWPGGRNQIDDLVIDPSRTGFRGRGMKETTLEVVRQHYHVEMADASAIALFWYYRNQIFFDQNLQADPRVILVRYEEMARHPSTELRKICQHVGLTGSPRMAGVIHSRSIDKDEPPSISPKIRRLCEQMLRRLDLARKRTGSAID